MSILSKKRKNKIITVDSPKVQKIFRAKASRKVSRMSARVAVMPASLLYGPEKHVF